jgi:hypothetical protein
MNAIQAARLARQNAAQTAANVPSRITDQYDTPNYGPEEIQNQIEGNPIRSSLEMVQPGTMTNRQQMPERPTVTLDDNEDPNFPQEQRQATPVGEPVNYNDMAEQGDRLAVPTNLPDFSSPGNAIDTLRQGFGQTEQSFDSLGYQDNERYTPKQGASKIKLGPVKAGDEASALSRMSSQIQSRILDSDDTIWANPAISDVLSKDLDLGKDPRRMEALGGAFLLTQARVASDIKSRRYLEVLDSEKDESKLSDDPFDFQVANIEPDKRTLDPESRKELFSEIMSDAPNQPVIAGLLNTISRSLGSLMNPPQVAGAVYKAPPVSPKLAAAVAFDMYDMGTLDFGRDKSGRWYPILKEEGRIMSEVTGRAAAIYDAELRHLNVNEPISRSQSMPPVNNAYAGLQFIFSKDGRSMVNDQNLTQAAANILSGTGVTVYANNLALMQQMQADIDANMIAARPDGTPSSIGDPMAIPNAYSTSIYAKSLLDLSRESFVEKVKELQAAKAKPEKIRQVIGDISSAKLMQIGKHLKDYLGGNLTRGARFTTVMISASTNRMFPTATDINTTNHAGTIRPGTDFAVKHSIRMTGKPAEMIEKSRKMSKELYRIGNLEGVNIGATIQRRLWAMSAEDRTMLGAMYQISKVAEDLGFHSVMGNRSAPDVYIEALTPEVFAKMAAFGYQAKAWAQNGQLPTSNDQVSLPPALQNKRNPLGDMFTKKEWGPRISNAIMAAEMTSAQAGGFVKAAATIETDASQSNALIISLLIGDTSVSNLLGNPVDEEAYTAMTSAFKDLRNLVASTINEDIDATMLADSEGEKASAMKQMFEDARAANPSGFDKMYARGIVVAGLYGKHAEYMFTEVQEMLSQMYATVGDQLNNIEENLYGGDRQKFIEDLASVYSTSTKRHLSGLKGYQQVASAIGEMKAAFNGSTKVKSFGNTEVDVGMSYLVGNDDETNIMAQGVLDLNDTQGFPMAGTARDLLAGGDFGKSQTDINQMKQRVADLNVNIPDYMNQIAIHSTFGDKPKKSIPVVLIQSGDSYQMATTLTYVNQGNPRKEPANILTVHDAGITDPSSTLLYINAFNNVAPHMMAANGRTILESLRQGLTTDIGRAAADVQKNKGANIGMKGKYRAVSGYFDRTYIYSLMESRDSKRGRVKKDSEKDRDEKNKAQRVQEVLNHAIANGWLPPTNRNSKARDSVKINPNEFMKLQFLMLEHSGLSPDSEDKYFLKGPRDKYWTSRNQRKLDSHIRNNSTMSALMKMMKKFITNVK